MGFGSPIAQNVNVSPNQGLQTLSGILGIKQQAQSLETGKAIQAGARAEAQTRTIAAQGKTEAADFLKNFDFKSHIGSDGTLDMDSAYADPKFQNAGPGKELIANALLGIKNNQIANKQNMATLNRNVVAGAAQLVGSLTGDPDIEAGNAQGIAKANSTIGVIRSMFPDQGGAITDQFSKIINGGHLAPHQLAAAVKSFALQASDVAAPKLGEVYDKQGNLVGTAQNQVSGQFAQAPGTGVGVGLGPTQTPAYQGAVARASTTGSGTGNIDVDRANTISGSQQAATASLNLTKRVDALSHEIANSAAAQKVTQGLHALGFSNIAAARTELQKDLGLLKGPVAARAGSDARAAELLEGYPTDTTPENTVHSAMDYIRGTMRQTIARGQLLHAHGVEGIAAADDELTRGTDPLMHEAASLKPGQSNGFYKRNFKSPEEAQAFKNRVDALKKHTNFLGGANE